MTYFIIYLLIGAIWSTICEFFITPEMSEDIGGNVFTRWLIGSLLWPLEVFFLFVEILKEK
jgi:hypothetical protein